MTVFRAAANKTVGQAFLPVSNWRVEDIPVRWGRHSCLPPTRIRSAGQECSTLADSDRQECLPHPNIRARTFLLVCLLGFLFAAPAIGATAPPPIDPTAHAQLDQVLHRPAYTAYRLRQNGHMPEVDPNFEKGWLDQIARPFRAIRDFLKWLFKSKNKSYSPSISSGEGLSTILKLAAWTVVGAIAIFLGIILIRIIGTTRPDVMIANVLSREQVRAAMESGDALAMGSSQWMDEARRLAGEQDFRAVYRALYLALLSGLHAAGKIEHNRNRTNWVYVQHYRGPEPERARFSELTELFDRIWYGRKPAEGNSLEQLRMDVDMLTGKGVA